MAPSANEPTYYILKRRIPSNQDWLGRIVQYFQDPTASYTPSQAISSILPSDILTTTESDFHLKLSRTKDSVLRTRLNRLLAIENSLSRHDDLVLDTPLLTHRRLTNFSKVFEHTKGNPEVTKDLQDMLPLGRTAYMIVGLVEIETACIQRSTNATKSLDNGVTLPVVDLALAAASVPVSLNGIGDIELQCGKKNSYSSETSSISRSKEIIAFEYRLIRRNFGGLGRQLVYRDSIPKIRAGLTFGAGDEEDESEDDDEEEEEAANLEILDKPLSTFSIGYSDAKRLVYDAGTGLLYDV